MLKKLKFAAVALLLPLLAFAQSYPSPTFNNLTVQGTFTLNGGVPPSSLAAQAANTVLANVTASSASPTAVAIPGCSTANSALKYTSGTGLTCGTTYALTSGTLGQFAATTSAQLAGVISDETGSGSLVFGTSPSISGASISGGGGINGVPIGGVTPSTGAFTNLSASGTVTGFIGRLLNVQVFTSSGTYTPTTGTASIIVDAVGGGGGGGGTGATGAGQSAAGSGGGGGSYARVLITSGFSGAAVTIGAAGTAATAGANPGGAGGTTSFGTFVSCPGGNGGLQGAASSAIGAGGQTLGGAAPTIAGASTIFASPGWASSAYALLVSLGAAQVSGGGANSPWGVGGAATASGSGSTAGKPGTGNGSGGSGANAGASQAGQAGAAGTAGIVIVYEYSQ